MAVVIGRSRASWGKTDVGEAASSVELRERARFLWGRFSFKIWLMLWEKTGIRALWKKNV